MIKPVSPSINWNNPLTRSLVWNVAAGKDSINSLINKTKGTLLASGSWGGNNLLGNALISTSTSNGGAYWLWSKNIEQITNQFSIVMFINFGTVTDNSHYFCIPYNSASWSSPFDSISLQGSSPNTALLQLQYNVGGSLNGQSTASNYITSGMGLTMIGATYNNGTVRFYMNGKFLEQTTGTSGSIDLGNKVEVVLLNRLHADTGEGTSGSTNFAGLWSRVLTDNEMLRIFTNPWKLYTTPIQSSLTTGIFH